MTEAEENLINTMTALENLESRTLKNGVVKFESRSDLFNFAISCSRKAGRMAKD